MTRKTRLHIVFLLITGMLLGMTERPARAAEWIDYGSGSEEVSLQYKNEGKTHYIKGAIGGDVEFLLDEAKELFSSDNYPYEVINADITLENDVFMQELMSGSSVLKEFVLKGAYVGDEAPDFYAMFSGCSHLEKVDFSGFTMPSDSNMEHIFVGCNRLTEVTFARAHNFSDDTIINMFSSGFDGVVKIKTGSTLRYLYSLDGALTIGTENPEATPTATPEPTETATPTPEPTEEPTETATPTPSEEPTDTATPTPSPSATKEPTNTPKATQTPTATSAPSGTPKATKTPTPTSTPKATKTPTPEPTETGTPTPKVTNTPTPTATTKPTTTPKPTNTPRPTSDGTMSTPWPTKGVDNTPTPTHTQAPKNTDRPTYTPGTGSGSSGGGSSSQSGGPLEIISVILLTVAVGLGAYELYYYISKIRNKKSDKKD